MAWVDVARSNFQEKMLWACVLRRTIFDFVLYKGSGEHKMRWMLAQGFIFGDPDDTDFGLTFEQICGLFNWDPEYLRRKVKELDRSSIKKLEAMKFKECFDDDGAVMNIEQLCWGMGPAVPIFPPYNYSREYRAYLKLRPIRPKVRTLYTPVTISWSLDS